VAQIGMEVPQWKGQLELRNAELGIPELAQPVKIAAATVVWQQQRLVIPALRASAGGLSWAGSYRYELGAVRPHRLVIDADTIEMAGLERVLGPVWRGKGFFSRAMGIEEKKESGAAEMEVRAKRIGILENVRASVWREGEKVTVSALSGEWRNGKLNGAGVIRLGGDADLTGTISSLPWEGGAVESDWRLTGKGPLFVRGTAKLTGGPADWLSGAYRWDSNGRVAITAPEASIDGRKVLGKVTGPAEGPLTVEFADAPKLRISGKPFAVTIEAR
jgi:hypothetical protein